jgi:hypothetical protein
MNVESNLEKMIKLDKQLKKETFSKNWIQALYILFLTIEAKELDIERF